MTEWNAWCVVISDLFLYLWPICSTGGSMAVTACVHDYYPISVVIYLHEIEQVFHPQFDVAFVW